MLYAHMHVMLHSSLESDLSHITQQHRMQRDALHKLQTQHASVTSEKSKLQETCASVEVQVKQQER